MADPTGARMRPINAFFDSPRFPIDVLPSVDGKAPDSSSTGAFCVVLRSWNAYIGAQKPS
jgi:hypothetical protein